MSGKLRIGHIDGLRGIAALAVVLHHYLWIPLFPASATADDSIWMHLRHDLFEFGHYGVELFFMISGFVILMTLQRTRRFIDFLCKRWIRLMPAKLLGSLLIYGASQIIPAYPFANRRIDLLPGLTFTQPHFITRISGIEVFSIDAAFWTLYIEMQFYIVAGLLFAWKPHRALAALLIMAAGYGMVSAWAFAIPALQAKMIAFENLTLFKHLPWFCFGMALFNLSKKHSNFDGWMAGLSLALIFTQPNAEIGPIARIALPAIFLSTIYWHTIQQILSHRWLLFLGFISYPLYLIHQHLYYAIANILEQKAIYLGGAVALLPFVMIPAVMALAYGIAKWGEPAMAKWMRQTIYGRPTSRPYKLAQPHAKRAPSGKSA